MGRPVIRLAMIGLAVVVALSLAVTVAAHGNILSADSQVTADGTVRIEGAVLVTKGWVVIHADDGGELGEVIGHAPAEQNVFTGDLLVPTNLSERATGEENRSIWAVLHYDADGDGRFDSASDPPIGGRDDPDHAINLDIRQGERPAYVLAEREHPQRTNTSEIAVRRAHLPTDGYLVIRTDDDGTPGAVVGHRALDAGRHDEVTVQMDDEAYSQQSDMFSLWAVVYRSDGNSQFDGGDDPIRVGGSMVASHFQVNRTDASHSNHTHTPTASATPDPSTATPASSGHDDDHEHEGQGHSTQSPTGPTTEASTPTAGANGPGFGTLIAVLAVLVGSITVRFGRR